MNLVPLSKHAAESSLSGAELALAICAALVVIGWIVEHNAKPKVDPWLPSSIKPPGWKSPGWDWKKIAGFVGLASILGALLGDAVVWISSDALQAISDRETADLTARNLTLEQQIQPRRLNADQMESLTAMFRGFQGNTVYISSYMLDAEGFLLGEQILGAALAANLPVNTKNLMGLQAVSGAITGVDVTGTNAELVRAATATLTSFGLMPPTVVGDPGVFMSMEEADAPYSLKIFVGVKPLGPP